jgi:ABC-type uncharacterized transport system substrate-binding protein
MALRAPAQTASPYRVAWVSLDQPGSNSPPLAAFRQGMAELGYVEGKDLLIDTWFGAGSADRLAQMRPDILRTQPDVIVTQGGGALTPMLGAGVNRPIVFGMSADPVEAKIAASYARPGGNATGITLFAAELTGKRLALLKEVLPSAKRIAVIANPSHPGEHKEWAESETAAAKLGLTLQHFPVQTETELDSALAEVARSHIDAVLVFSDGFALDYAGRIAAFSAQQRIPTIAGWAPFAQRGNLLVYGPVFADVYRRLASYVDRIRKGAKPGDLPIEQPTKLELVINLRTAKALGLTIPQSLLVRADDAIQ